MALDVRPRPSSGGGVPVPIVNQTFTTVAINPYQIVIAEPPLGVITTSRYRAVISLTRYNQFDAGGGDLVIGLNDEAYIEHVTTFTKDDHGNALSFTEYDIGEGIVVADLAAGGIWGLQVHYQFGIGTRIYQWLAKIYDISDFPPFVVDPNP